MALTHRLSNYRGLSFQPSSRRKTPARRTGGPRQPSDPVMHL